MVVAVAAAEVESRGQGPQMASDLMCVLSASERAAPAASAAAPTNVRAQEAVTARLVAARPQRQHLAEQSAVISLLHDKVYWWRVGSTQLHINGDHDEVASACSSFGVVK